MRRTIRSTAKLLLASSLGVAALAGAWTAHAAPGEPAHSQALDDAVIAAAKRHGVPESLVRRIIMRESKYNARARNGLYWGLMQISYPTARSMGFKGTREQLLDPVVNLRYAVPYLANAWRIAGKTEDAAVRLYAAGYYFTARTRGMLAGLRTAESPSLSGVPDEVAAPEPVLAANANAQPPQSVGIFGALFSPGQQPMPTQVAAYAADTSAQQQQGQAQVAVAAAQVSSAAPAGTFKSTPVDMTAGKDGTYVLPKKWTRDGGKTVITRGEQGLDRLADRGQPAVTKAGHGRKAKITLTASLDAPSSNAQAYAAPAGQDPRFGAAQSQAAIMQATAGQSSVAPTQPSASGSEAQVAVAADTTTSAAVEAAPKPAKHAHARRAKRQQAESRTQQALADSKPSSTVAQDLRPAQ